VARHCRRPDAVFSFPVICSWARVRSRWLRSTRKGSGSPSDQISDRWGQQHPEAVHRLVPRPGESKPLAATNSSMLMESAAAADTSSSARSQRMNSCSPSWAP
jgi:hypothetical protein